MLLYRNECTYACVCMLVNLKIAAVMQMWSILLKKIILWMFLCYLYSVSSCRNVFSLKKKTEMKKKKKTHTHIHTKEGTAKNLDTV